MYAIETVGLERGFRGRRVIQGLDLHVGRGEVYGFIGRNGSGKSTTMRMVAGLLAPDAGVVRVLGRALAPCEPHPALGSLIESPGVYPNLSAYDNLMTKALVLGVVDAPARCRELLAVVGLAETGRKRVRGFSMGMRQRLGVAMALLGNPDVLMLDEPLNGLDPEGAREIRSLLSRLNRERGVTVLISSHVLDQLERVCTCYGVIRDGRMVRELTAAELERECASYLALSCAEPQRALAVLSDAFPALAASVLPDDAIRIDGGADAAEVGRALAGAGIAVSELHRAEGDVEEFFVRLMGGQDEPAETGAGRRGRHAARPGRAARGGEAR